MCDDQKVKEKEEKYKEAKDYLPLDAAIYLVKELMKIKKENTTCTKKP